MIRARTILLVGLPLVAVLVWATASTHASAGGDEPNGFWPAANPDVAARKQRPPRPPRDTWGTPPAPPAPPVAGTPATPPVPPTPGRHRVGGRGVTVSIHDGKISIDGIDDMVHTQLDAVREVLLNNPRIPKDLRDKLLARVDKVRGIVDKRLRTIKSADLDTLGEEMDKMGDEIQSAMDGLDADLQVLGDKLAKDLTKKLGKDLLKNFKNKQIHIDSDASDSDSDSDNDDDDDVGIPAPDVDADDTDISGVKGMALKPSQRDVIVKLRESADRDIANVKKQLDEASKKLEVVLADPKVSDADVANYVDAISRHEAAIRKARILTWVKARRVLDDDQRKTLEAAAKHKSHP